MGFITIFRLSNRSALSGNNLMHFIFRIVNMSNLTDAKGAGVNAGRLHSLSYPVIAPGTFFCNIMNRMKKTGKIGTVCHAITATYAPLSVDKYNAVAGLVRRSHRTDLHA